MTKKTVIVEEREEDVLYHPRVIAQSVERLEKALTSGLKNVADQQLVGQHQLEQEIKNISKNFATVAYVDAKVTDADLKHEMIADDISNVDKRVSKIERWFNWTAKIVFGAVIAAILALIGLSAFSGAHTL